MSSCRNPDILCFILSSLSPSLSRCRVFLSRHPCVWNSISRAFAENIWQKFTIFRNEICIEIFNSKHNGHRFTAVITAATCGLILHLVTSLCLPPPSPPRPPPHPQPRVPDLSGHCRTSTASARFQRVLPEPNCERGSQWAQPDTTSARSKWAVPLSYQMGGGRHPRSKEIYK